MDHQKQISAILTSRRALAPEGGFKQPEAQAAEGGCGVIGFASNQQVAAKHMLQALIQMRNRGNGKGGGIAAVGLVAEEFGVSQEVLENDYLLAIAYLDESVRANLERDFIDPVFEIDHQRQVEHIADFRELEEMEVRPPEIVEYFVRVKPAVVEAFIAEQGMAEAERRVVEDEIVFQNTYKINTTYYESVGEKQAFVLSHGKNLLVVKMVGYGDDVIRYYKLEDMRAHVWIGHHRFPTKGRVWHPGGAHPFIGLNEALVHNGDFANHASISEYLAQRNIYPLFLTDTEVAVQVFDLLHRTYAYPLEYVIEAMAPTTERDFTLLPPDKQELYEMLQVSHMHSSPDGPWFFLIAQSDTHDPGGPVYRLTGITDTSMLRPQVFAWQENETADGEKVSIGFAASEKQAIDAALTSLAETDPRFWRRADRYWNARGGSYTDGGAFLFTVQPDASGKPQLTVRDKFDNPVPVPTNTRAYQKNGDAPVRITLPDQPPILQFGWFTQQLSNWGYPEVLGFIKAIEDRYLPVGAYRALFKMLDLLRDRRYNTYSLRRSSLLALFDASFDRLIAAIQSAPVDEFLYHAAGMALPSPKNDEQHLVLDARGYTPQDETSVAHELKRLYKKGFKKFVVVHLEGHRFIGNSFGPDSHGVRMDVFGSPGDYLASGLDGMEIHCHTNGQDQLSQIMKAGTLVVYGDVGQTFMYGAKGGDAYILGNAAGRPLINAVGKPRVVINGTCLDYLAESFMAGDPLNGGGFVVLNGLAFDEANQIVELESPYPGGNLFSLASGGAIYVRDPHNKVTEDQLNGGEFAPLAAEDWALIEPYLAENERHFGIPTSRLLTVDGQELPPEQVYRKIQPMALRALLAEEAWVTQGEGH